MRKILILLFMLVLLISCNQDEKSPILNSKVISSVYPQKTLSGGGGGGTGDNDSVDTGYGAFKDSAIDHVPIVNTPAVMDGIKADTLRCTVSLDLDSGPQLYDIDVPSADKITWDAPPSGISLVTNPKKIGGTLRFVEYSGVYNFQITEYTKYVYGSNTYYWPTTIYIYTFNIKDYYGNGHKPLKSLH
jgi:hypothetical protein